MSGKKWVPSKRRAIITGLVGAAFLGGREFPRNKPAPETTAPIVQTNDSTNANLSVKEAATAYKNLEKLIGDELKAARKEGKKLKIIMGEVHRRGIPLLADLFACEAAMHNGIKSVSCEATPKEGKILSAFAQDAKPKKISIVDHPDASNFENAFYYLSAHESHSSTSWRFIDDEELRAKTLEFYIKLSTLTEKELENPQLYAARYQASIDEGEKLHKKREEYMAGKLVEKDEDEMFVCGKDHALPVKELVEKNGRYRVLVLEANNELLGSDIESLVNEDADRNLQGLKYPPVNSYAQIEWAKNNGLRKVVEEVSRKSLLETSAALKKANAHPIFDGEKQLRTQRPYRILEFFRTVKESLGHSDIVFSPKNFSPPSPRGMG